MTVMHFIALKYCLQFLISPLSSTSSSHSHSSHKENPHIFITILNLHMKPGSPQEASYIYKFLSNLRCATVHTHLIMNAYDHVFIKIIYEGSVALLGVLNRQLHVTLLSSLSRGN
jgi:hypothetical protein